MQKIIACFSMAFICAISLNGCSDDENAAQNLYIQSTQDVKNGRTDSAELKLEKAVSLNPEFNAAKLSLGEIKYSVGKYGEAITALQEVVAADSSDYSAIYLLANSYAKKGEYKKATEQYSRAIKLRPDSVLAYNNFAAALTALNRFDEALAAYQTVIAMLMKSSDPAAKAMLVTAYFDAATALGRKGDYKKALEVYQTAIMLKPDFAEAYYYLGITHYNMGDLKSAAQALRGAVRVKPDFARAYNDLGIICGKLGDSAACFNYLGMTEVLQGKFADAIALYKKAIARKPNFTEAQFNIGLAQSYSGDLREAEKTFSAVVAAKPDYLDAYLQLQTIYSRLGEKEKSDAAQRKALELGAKASKNLRQNTFKMQ